MYRVLVHMITVFALLQIPSYCSVEHHQPDVWLLSFLVGGGVFTGV